jgi:hypothetical protein
MTAHLQYASYLIRLWRMSKQAGTPAAWQSEIEHIQSGKRWNFQSLEELEAFLHQRATEPAGLYWIEAQAVER